MLKGSSGWLTQVKRALRSPHFWLIFALFIGCGVLHYIEHIGITDTAFPSFHFGLARHAFDRILLLVPIIYSGLIFGLAGGLIACLVALFLMLPRALLISPSPADALLETAGIILVGILACLWFRAQAKRVRAEEQRKLALDMMDKAQQKLRSQVRITMEHQERLTTLSAISSLLAEPLELERTLRIAIDMAMKVMRADAVLLFLLNEQTDELVLTAYEGVSQQLVQDLGRVGFSEVFNGRVTETGEAVVLDNSRGPRSFRSAARQENLQSQLIVPVKSKGKAVGALWIATHRQKDFPPEDTKLSVAIANQIGAALENARLYEAACQTAERLYKSEREYRSLFENAQDAIWFHNFDGTILAANKAAERLTGYDVESLIGMNVACFLSEEERELAKDVGQKLIAGEAFAQPYEQKLVRKDNSQATFMLTSSLITLDGQAVGFQHIARDVTEEKRMEENLRFYLQHITKVQEEERRRMSRELHDSTAQTLIAILHQLEDFLENKTGLRMRDTRSLWKLHEEVRTVLHEVRQFGRDLRPSILDDLGLIPSLEWLCSEIGKESGIDTRLQAVGAERRFSAEVELVLFRIIQEALRNVARHSSASQVQITVAFNERTTLVTVEDNGRGFALPETIADLSRLGKLGLTGMQERARLLGGSLKVESELDKGTKVIVEVPL